MKPRLAADDQRVGRFYTRLFARGPYWALTDALLDFHLSGADSEALGGNFAYQYGNYHRLVGIGLTPAQAILSSLQFGVSEQTPSPIASLQDELVKLG